MFKNVPALLSLVAILSLQGCDQTFDSRAPFRGQLVVFSILSTDRSSQFVRVEGTYMPTGYEPLSSTSDNSITNAIVTVSDGMRLFQLRDTIFTRPDTSRYKFPLRAFVANPLVPVPGRTYNVSVRALGFSSAAAAVVVPGKGYPGSGLTTSLIVDNPGAYGDDDVMIFNALLSAATRGYIGRLFVDYDVLIGSEWVERRSEIPLDFINPDVPNLNYVTYPQLSSRIADRIVMAFSNRVYKAILRSIASDKFKSDKLIFNRVIFQLLQAEKNLYNYYNTTHAFRDAQSVRLDEPLFSNIAGGAGVVGAYSLDSLVHLLPENFPFNNK